MSGSGVSSRIDIEGASNGTDDAVVAQADGQVSDGSLASHEMGVYKGPCPTFLKFLDCDVVVELLMQYLKLEEMKVLCLVSKHMLAKVMKTREFAKRARFTVKRKLVKKSPASNADLLHQRFPFPWKHMSFDVALPMDVVNQFADKLECVESLLLYHNRYSSILCRLREASPSIVAEVCVRVHEILSMTMNLRELQLNLLLFKFPLKETFSSWKVQQSMSNLESLTFDGSCIVEEGSLDYTHFQQNLLQLSRSPLSKLKRFCITCTADSDLDPIVDTIKAFKETLEELELIQNTWRIAEMKAVRFPKLKKLALGFYERDLKDVAEFVERHPQLEEVFLEPYSSAPAEDFKCFQGRLQNLRKFQYWLRYNSESGIEVDWTFLDTMTKLEEFTVHLPFGGRGPEMIDRIPVTVTKLRVSCNRGGQDFWSRRNHLEDFSPNIGSHLKRLKNLTHLTFYRCSDALTDVGLQTIIKTCPNLMELRLMKCAKLTDFGISGVNENDGVDESEPGVPLSDLKGLVELKISHCDLVTATCIQTVVRFKCLRSFTFKTSKENEIQDVDQFVSRIREQNPRLISLRHNRHTWMKNGHVWAHERKRKYEYDTVDVDQTITIG